MIGKTIKYEREKRGWSQDELAEKLGYNGKSAISLIEANKRDLTLDKVKAFADAFGVSPGYLMKDYLYKGNGAEVVVETFDKLSEGRKNDLLKYMEYLEATDEERK